MTEIIDYKSARAELETLARRLRHTHRRTRRHRRRKDGNVRRAPRAMADVHLPGDRSSGQRLPPVRTRRRRQHDHRGPLRRGRRGRPGLHLPMVKSNTPAGSPNWKTPPPWPAAAQPRTEWSPSWLSTRSRYSTRSHRREGECTRGDPRCAVPAICRHTPKCSPTTSMSSVPPESRCFRRHRPR